MTPRQRRILGWLNRQSFVSDALYFRFSDRYEKKATRRYYRLLNRRTAYNGPDFRLRFSPTSPWIRATKLQYDQALELGIERSIGVPEIVWPAPKQIDRWSEVKEAA